MNRGKPRVSGPFLLAHRLLAAMERADVATAGWIGEATKMVAKGREDVAYVYLAWTATY